MTDQSKFQKFKSNVKTHFRENKEAYIYSIVGAVTGAVTGAVVGTLVNEVGMKDSVAVSNTNAPSQKVLFGDAVMNNYNTVLVSRDNPSIPVRCIDTGEVFASQSRAAQANGLDSSDLSRHLRGIGGDHVKGLRFERIEPTAQ